MNIDEAMTLLEQNKITTSKQMLRRWIRQEKIQATLHSKKEGYMIDEASLQSFIEEKKRTGHVLVNNEPGFDEGYQAGYAAALLEVSDRFKKMAFMGMYENQFPIYRSEFRELCSRRISKHKIKEFMIFADEEFFSKKVSKPRSQVWCNSIGNYFYFELAHLLINQDDYEIDNELGQEFVAYELLVKKLNDKFIHSVNVTSKKKRIDQ